MDSSDERAARARSEGWAWGSAHGGEWLTIAGSAIDTARLAERPEDAVPPPPIIGDPHILARVERRGTYFRILERAADEQQHYLITVPDGKYPHLVTGWCSCSTWEWDGTRNVFATGWRFSGYARRGVVSVLYYGAHGRLPVPAEVG